MVLVLPCSSLLTRFSPTRAHTLTSIVCTTYTRGRERQGGMGMRFLGESYSNENGTVFRPLKNICYNYRLVRLLNITARNRTVEFKSNFERVISCVDHSWDVRQE